MKIANWVRKYGIRNLSTELHLSYETVRLWAHGKTPPLKHISKIIELSDGELSAEDFVFDKSA